MLATVLSRRFDRAVILMLSYANDGAGNLTVVRCQYEVMLMTLS
jgi:hypothetical protein